MNDIIDAASGDIKARARMAAELFFPYDMVWQKRAYQYLAAALFAEREACAKIAFAYLLRIHGPDTAADVAAVIRRGEP